MHLLKKSEFLFCFKKKKSTYLLDDSRIWVYVCVCVCAYNGTFQFIGLKLIFEFPRSRRIINMDN